MVLCWIAKFRIKLKYVLAALCLITVAFIVRQITWLDDLTEDYVRGVHVKQARFYVPNENGKFQCLVNGKFIDFVKVNDDYCDCEDGTDEPGTDACPNGKFYCKIDEYKRKAVPLPAGRVNDGICDCCDGSDEWKNDRSKASVGFRSGPCPNVC